MLYCPALCQFYSSYRKARTHAITHIRALTQAQTLACGKERREGGEDRETERKRD